jgi:hypothetical protein
LAQVSWVAGLGPFVFVDIKLRLFLSTIFFLGRGFLLFAFLIDNFLLNFHHWPFQMYLIAWHAFGLFVPDRNIPDDSHIGFDPVNVVADQVFSSLIVVENDVPLIALQDVLFDVSQIPPEQIDVVQSVLQCHIQKQEIVLTLSYQEHSWLKDDWQ